jgi:transcription elongation GreA/GreB family factor
MRGAASQIMRADGLVGAHPSLPFHSVVRITNPGNGRVIEVTIVDRINPSPNRIIDLSPAAMQALDMRAGEEVILTVPASMPQPQRQAEQIINLSEPVLQTQGGGAPVVGQASSGEIVIVSGQVHVDGQATAGEQASAVVQIDISGQVSADLPRSADGQIISGGSHYIPPAGQEQQSPHITSGLAERDLASHLARTNDSTEFLAWLMAMSIDARESRDAREVREIREAREARELREAREAREVREAREARELREAREIREAREMRESVLNQGQGTQVRRTPDPQPRTTSQPAPRREAESHPAAQPVPQSVQEPVVQPIQQPAVQTAPRPEPRPAAQPLFVNPSVNPSSVNPPVDDSFDESEGLPVSSGGPLVTNINTLVPDLRVAANQGNLSRQVQPSPVRPEALQIIPGLPDRSSGRVFRLQVGAYSAQDAANRAAQLINSAGFLVETDYSGSVYRVMAAGIAAVDVYSAAVRLGALGFGQIWVRE